MGYDSFVAAAMAAELGEAATGRKVTSVDTAGGQGILLWLGPRREPVWLVLSLGSEPAVYYGAGALPPVLGDWPEPPAGDAGFARFVRLLEARLAGRVLTAATPLNWERAIELSFSARGGLRGDGEPCRLVHEAAPRPARAGLLRGDRTVVAAYPSGDAARFRAGAAYEPPDVSGRASPAFLAENRREFDLALARASLRHPDAGPERLVASLAPALGPLASAEVARRARSGGPEALYEAFREMVSRYPGGPFAPALLIREPEQESRKTERILSRPAAESGVGAAELSVVTPAAPPGWMAVWTRSAGEAVAAWHASRLIEGGCRDYEARLGRVLRSALAKASRKVSSQRADLEEAGDPQDLRLRGELLLVHLRAVPAGSKEVTLPDYEGRQVTIALDPRLSPAANAERYFRRYKKARRAWARSLPRDKAAAELEWLESVSFDLKRLQPGYEESRSKAGSDSPAPDPWSDFWDRLRVSRGRLAEYMEIEETLAKAGYAGLGKAKTGSPAVPKVSGASRLGPGPGRQAGEPWSYLTGDGLAVLAGRSARQNETLSLKTAQPWDLWFHARGCPGSHILLRLEAGSTPPEASILEAAALAAHLSAARGGGKVAVDYTEARHLRRPRGAPPGLVLYDPHQTVLVDTERVRLPRSLDAPGSRPESRPEGQ